MLRDQVRDAEMSTSSDRPSPNMAAGAVARSGVRPHADAPRGVGADRVLLDSLSEAAVILGPGGVVRYANPRFAGLVGEPPERIIGTTLEQWCAPSDAARVREVVAGSAHDGELALQAANGTTIPVHVAVARIPEPDAVCLILTDLRHAAIGQGDSRYRAIFETTLQLIADSLPILIASVDTEQRYRFISLEYERWFGMPCAQMVGRTVREVVGKAAYEAIRPHMEAALGGQRVSFEQWVDHEYAGRRYIQGSYIPQIDEAGAVRGLFVLIADLTQRKRAEEGLQASEERYRSLVSAAASVVWTADADGQFVTPQPSWESFTGQGWEEYAGWGWSQAAYSGDQERVRADWSRAVATRAAYHEELRLWHEPSGQYRHVVARAAPVLNADGSVREWVGTVTDVDERKRAEDALRASQMRLAGIIDSAMDAVITVDAEQHVIVFNQAAERMFQCPASEAVGQTIDRFIPERFRSTHTDRVLAFGNTGATSRAMGSLGTLFAVRADGTEFPIEATISQIQSGGQRLYTVIIRDITERKHQEERLMASLREKEVLLKEIHHRVKNNLQVVSSLLNLQSTSLRDPHVLALFKDSQNRIQSMALVHEMLYQSQNLSSISFRSYLDNLIGRIRGSYGTSSPVALQLDADEAIVGIDTAIPCALLVNELVANALEHAFPDGRGGTVHVGLRAEADGSFTLRVSDDGIGLPASIDLESVESLGLRLVQALTRQLEGTLDFSRDGGTTCTIRFHEMFRKPRI